MREILLATDGSEDAQRACRLLAGLPRPEGGRVTVVTVISPAAGLWVGRIPPEEWLSAAVWTQEEEAVRLMAQEAADRLSAGGWETDVKVRVGPPAHAILETATEVRPDLIVTGSKGLTGIPAFLLGSVSQNVARHAECSVLVVRGHQESIRSVLIGVDGSREAERAVTHLLTLPLPEGSEKVACTVLHVLEPLSVQWDSFLTETDLVSLRARVEQGRLASAEHLVERVAATLRAAGRQAEPLVVHGHPAQQLMEIVKERAPDLLIVGARGLNAVEAFLLGSVSGRMLRYAPCSVLVAR